MLTIKLKAVKSFETPEEAEKRAKFSPGYAAGVRATMKTAEAPWGWCDVCLDATIEVASQKFLAQATLGCSSYHSEADFISNSGYFDDMLKDVVADLKEQLLAAGAVPDVKPRPEMLVSELCGYMSAYGAPAGITRQFVTKLEKGVTGKKEMLGKYARTCWDGCMRNPESASKLTPVIKERVATIMELLDQYKPEQ